MHSSIWVLLYFVEFAEIDKQDTVLKILQCHSIYMLNTKVETNRISLCNLKRKHILNFQQRDGFYHTFVRLLENVRTTTSQVW